MRAAYFRGNPVVDHLPLRKERAPRATWKPGYPFLTSTLPMQDRFHLYVDAVSLHRRGTEAAHLPTLATTVATLVVKRDTLILGVRRGVVGCEAIPKWWRLATTRRPKMGETGCGKVG